MAGAGRAPCWPVPPKWTIFGMEWYIYSVVNTSSKSIKVNPSLLWTDETCDAKTPLPINYRLNEGANRRRESWADKSRLMARPNKAYRADHYRSLHQLMHLWQTAKYSTLVVWTCLSPFSEMLTSRLIINTDEWVIKSFIYVSYFSSKKIVKSVVPPPLAFIKPGCFILLVEGGYSPFHVSEKSLKQ